MIIINSVSIYPNRVDAGQSFKIAVRVSDLSWNNIQETYSTWEAVKEHYATWQAVKEDNAAQISWNDIRALTDWSAVQGTYYEWFNLKDNIK